MRSLITHENFVTAPVEDSDAGIILKRDGSFKIFSTGNLQNENSLTLEQLEQGRKLIALSVALRCPDIMNFLLSCADDPDLFDDEELLSVGTRQ